MSIREQEVRHGYTITDLHQLTVAAIKADRSMAMDYADRRDIAWSAIAEALCAAEEPPRRGDLIRAGWQAIYNAVREEYRQHGYADRAWDSGYATAPRFLQFWFPTVVRSHEDRIVERIAVHQILDTLTPTYRDAIIALAVHDDYRRAAEGLNLKDSAFRLRLSNARQKLLTEWFEGETPRRVYAVDRRVGSHDKGLATHCRNGHEWTAENTYIRRRILRGKPHKSRVCKACEHDRSVQRSRDARERAA